MAHPAADAPAEVPTPRPRRVRRGVVISIVALSCVAAALALVDWGRVRLFFDGYSRAQRLVSLDPPVTVEIYSEHSYEIRARVFYRVAFGPSPFTELRYMGALRRGVVEPPAMALRSLPDDGLVALVDAADRGLVMAVIDSASRTSWPTELDTTDAERALMARGAARLGGGARPMRTSDPATPISRH